MYYVTDCCDIASHLLTLLLPAIKRYTLSNSDNVIISQLKEKLVSVKKYQYVLLVRLQAK